MIVRLVLGGIREAPEGVAGGERQELLRVESLLQREVEQLAVREQEAVLETRADSVLDVSLPKHAAMRRLRGRVLVLDVLVDCSHATDADDHPPCG